jgi:hypothetical protein
MSLFRGLPICVVNEDGTVVSEGKAASEPADLVRGSVAPGHWIGDRTHWARSRPALAMAACRVARGAITGDLHMPMHHKLEVHVDESSASRFKNPSVKMVE